MPAQSLLEINPDELFEKHTIAEIKNIQIKIQNEIEQKREELRTMVGEKCRDLLKAADTITEMKDTSRNVISAVIEMKQLCESLEEKRSLGFKQPVNKVIKTSNNPEEISRVVEIKILLTLPEQIWSAIDEKDYLLGAQLFLFATHLHLGLEVSSNSQAITKKYPVLNKQWEVITSCKKVLIDGACDDLKAIDIPHQKAAECLCSLILLEVTSYEKLLNQFLDLKMASLIKILNSDDVTRKKLRHIVELLQHTLEILFICFLDKPSKKSAIQSHLNSITEDSKPTLSKLPQMTSFPHRYLSPLILNFRPKASNKLIVLNQNYIKDMLIQWLERVEKLLKTEVSKLLILIDDIKRLQKIIQDEVLSLKNPNNWEEIGEALVGDSKLNIYNKFLKNYVTERIKALIEVTWQNTLSNVLICLNKIDEDALKDRVKQMENDIRWFVWKEVKVDTEEGLKLKTLGFTPRVMELCGRMDSFLSQLLSDVKLFVEDDVSSKLKDSDNSEAKSILLFLNSCSLEMIKTFTQRVKESYKPRENPSNDSSIIIRARFLSSLTTESSGLEKCLRYNLQHLQQDFEDNSSHNTWQEAVAFLNEESTKMWHLWRQMMSNKLRDLIKKKLGDNISLRSLLRCKLLSEVITIEEQSEDGTTVNSDLRVPSQPSLPLQDLLFQICQQLNAIIPHTLPRKIHQELVDTLVKDILEHYKEWSNCEVIYQSQAWQMLLDVRYLTLLLVTKENKDLSQSICDTLEKTIDPFDLDVYYPHLQNSIKKSTQKLQGTFGVLINFNEKLPVFNGLKLTQSNSKVEEPNLLAVSSTVPWFPLLPVTSFGSRRSDSSRFENQSPFSDKEYSSEKISAKTKEKEKKESVTSDFFKSAGAFLDAMTNRWS